MRNLICLMTLVWLLLLILSSGCKDTLPKSSITLMNSSDMDISYYFAFGGEGGILYPDTTLSTLSATLTPPFPEARKGQSGYYDCHCTEEEIFEFIPSDTLSLYIFHPDTLAKYEWQKIIEDYKILKRYDLSLGDLQRLGFEVMYPPNANTDGIQMYPPE